MTTEGYSIVVERKRLDKREEVSKTMKKSKKMTSGLLVKLSVLSALAVTSGFFATATQAAVDSKKDMIVSAEKVTKKVDSDEKQEKKDAHKLTGTQQDHYIQLAKGTGTVTDKRDEEKTIKKDSTTIDALHKLTPEQAAPFIKAAKEAFLAHNIQLPESGYWISSTAKYVDENDDKTVKLFWYPEGVKENEKTKEKVYYASFGHADLVNGTGKLKDIEMVWDYGKSYWYPQEQ